MSLAESSSIDSVRVVETGHLEVRRVTVVTRDGTEIARTYQRHVLSPGDDVTGEEDRVQRIAEAVWTPEVVAAEKARQESPAP